MNDENIYRYTIDGDNRIVSVSENWTDFALKNKASPEVVPPDVLGKSIFYYITDSQTKHIYKTIIDAVREKKSSIKIPINCDSPELRRRIDITLEVKPNGEIEFISEIVKVEEREPVHLLNPEKKRSEDYVRICSFCKKVEVAQDTWQETEQAMQTLNLFEGKSLPVMEQLVCPSCFEGVIEKVDDLKKKVFKKK